MKRAVLTTLCVLLLGAAPAHAWMLLGTDTTKPGRVALLVWGSGSFEGVDISERVDGVDVPYATVEPPATTGPDGQVYSGDYYERGPVWRCDRLTRVFTAVGRRADGTTETATANVRTPSCRNRLALIAPRTRRPGRKFHVVIRDRWRNGGVAVRLCVRPPGERDRCDRLRIEEGREARSFAFRARERGHWRVALTAPKQRERTVVSVGVPPPRSSRPLPLVLATGDSLMLSVDAVLTDRLTDRAQVRSDVYIGSGLSKSFPTDWTKLPARQVKRHRPKATVIFLGTTDGWPMKTPGGAEVECCGEPWVAEYARRARRTMRAYLRSGPVLWLNVPAARDPKRKPSVDAVNAGLARAAKGLDRARVLDMAALFTPGGVYRDTMEDRGRSVRVRQSDGVHLSAAGAAIAVRSVVEQLERLGVV